ncbi:hypothetical protein P22_0615 [Propionispora sp. 2/2-37]|uniref:translocation/assembly module TamB domain-containing protein n=1 Tax=Propionispora sp. 2/2-37 TaxID=1677858 RepID=UPI0006BB5577|nr:translocation/assembly module TamB domain-containing protein [Propionispora sp. 2/2-37]CUH94549.1 hypothetical protein P22_0615 [Propionispora sp. 2/2-37]
MKGKAIVLLAAGLLVIAAGILVVNKSRMVMAGFQDRLAVELSQALDTTVTVGTLELNSFHSLTIHDLSVYDKQQVLLANSDMATVSFSLLSLITGKSAAEAVERVTVYKPSVYLIQRSAGDWNVEDLVKEQQEEQQHFGGKIELVGGRAVIQTAGETWQIDSVQGEADFADQPAIQVKGSALYREQPVKVEGRVNSPSGNMLTVWAEELALADFKVLFPSGGSLRPVDGTIKQATAIWQQQNGKNKLAGEAVLENTALDIDGVGVRDINGRVVFSEENLYLFATTARVLDQPLKLNGKVVFDTAVPVVDLTVASDGFDPAALELAIPLQGKVAFQAAVSGRVDNPVVEGEFRLPQGDYSGFGIANGKARLRMENQLVTLYDVQADMWGGHLTATGTVDIPNTAYQLQVGGKNIDSSAVPAGVAGLSGRADFEAGISGKGALQGAVINGSLQMASGSAGGIGFSNLAGGFFYQNEVLTLDYLNAKVGDGSISASGVVPLEGNALAVAVRGQAVPLAALRNLDNEINLDGTADFTGQVTGSLKDPVFTCDFTAADGQVFQQPFTSAQGGLVLTTGSLQLHKTALFNGAGSHQIDGSLALTGNKEVNMHIVSRKVRAENLVALLAPGENLTGNVDNDLTVTGPVNNINMEGSLILTEGSFRGQLIARAEGAYQRKNGVTTVNHFLVDSLNTKIAISGTVNPDNQLNFDVTAQDIDLAKLHVNFPYPVSGQANFTGKLTGTMDNPLFDGQLAAAALEFNGQTISGVDSRLDYQNNQLTIYYLKFQQDTGSFNFRGGVNLTSNEVYGSLEVTNGRLPSLLSVFNVPAHDVDGLLNGRIQVRGVLPKPDIWLNGSLSSGKIKEYPLDSVELDLQLVNDVLTVNKLDARQGMGVLAARGTADFNGAINMEVGGRDIDAGLITALSDVALPVKGKLGFAAQISGKTRNLHADMSMEITEGSVGNATVDSLYGLFMLDDGKIQVNQLLLTQGPYRASAYGVIPLAALSSAGRQQGTAADQMDIKLRLDEADLSILPVLSKEISWAQGPTRGELTIQGTLAQPRINGSFSVQGGVVKPSFLNDPIQNVGVDIRFEDDKININTFEGYMGAGSYHLTGTVRLQGWTLADYNLTAAMENLGVNSKYFKGPLNGNLALVSTPKRPVLSGRIVLENDTIDIPALPDLEPSDLKLGMDLEVIAKNKVRLYNPYLYDMQLGGHVHFGGTTRWPDVSGRFFAKRGSVSYLRTQFKIKEAVAEFTQVGSLVPVIHLNAETKLQRTKVNLDINGPVDEMNFSLTSEPAMSQQEILSLLTLRSRYFERQNDGQDNDFGRDELLGMLDAGLQIRFVSELESMLQNALGVDEFHFVRDTFTDGSSSTGSATAEREGYNLEMTKYLTDRFLITYTIGVDHDEYQWDFRYDLSRRISLTGGTDNENDHRLGMEYRYRF